MDTFLKKTKAKTYILLGPPGSGKSTQADFFKNRYGAVHLDMGGALRAAAQERTAFGENINEIINVRQALVPDDVMQAVLERELEKVSRDAMLVIDGTPRRRSQIDEVSSALAKVGRQIDKVVFLELSEADSVERISHRFSCADCGAKLIQGKDFQEGGRCPRCGGKPIQREDDTPDGVRKRWKIFHNDTLPVLEYFESRGSLVRVSGTDDPKQIFCTIMGSLRKFDFSRFLYGCPLWQLIRSFWRKS